MFVVIEHLVFVADRAALALVRDEIFQPAVAAVGDDPFPGKFELGIFLDRHEIAAAALGDVMQPAVTNVPALFGWRGFFVARPARERLAVEEQFPAGGFLRVGQRVDVRRKRARGRGGDEGEGEEGAKEFYLHDWLWLEVTLRLRRKNELKLHG